MNGTEIATVSYSSIALNETLTFLRSVQNDCFYDDYGSKCPCNTYCDPADMKCTSCEIACDPQHSNYEAECIICKGRMCDTTTASAHQLHDTIQPPTVNSIYLLFIPIFIGLVIFVGFFSAITRNARTDIPDIEQANLVTSSNEYSKKDSRKSLNISACFGNLLTYGSELISIPVSEGVIKHKHINVKERLIHSAPTLFFTDETKPKLCIPECEKESIHIVDETTDHDIMKTKPTDAIDYGSLHVNQLSHNQQPVCETISQTEDILNCESYRIENEPCSVGALVVTPIEMRRILDKTSNECLGNERYVSLSDGDSSSNVTAYSNQNQCIPLENYISQIDLSEQDPFNRKTVNTFVENESPYEADNSSYQLDRSNVYLSAKKCSHSSEASSHSVGLTHLEHIREAAKTLETRYITPYNDIESRNTHAQAMHTQMNLPLPYSNIDETQKQQGLQSEKDIYIKHCSDTSAIEYLSYKDWEIHRKDNLSILNQVIDVREPNVQQDETGDFDEVTQLKSTFKAIK